MIINEVNEIVYGDGFIKFIIDNVNCNFDIVIVIINENSFFYEVDELEMKNYGVFYIYGDNLSLVVYNFIGDCMGFVYFRFG